MLIDSHCHVYMPEFEADRPEVLARARAAGLVAFVVIGYDLPSSRQAVDLAEALRLPVSVHDRAAHADTMRILSEDAHCLPTVVLHCFNGDRAMAAEAWSRGYYTAVGGPVTYPNAGGLRDWLETTPRDRVLLETDAPYLPPAPHRGKRNEPAYLGLVAERLAALSDAGPDMVADLTTRNACRAFGFPLAGAVE